MCAEAPSSPPDYQRETSPAVKTHLGHCASPGKESSKQLAVDESLPIL